MAESLLLAPERHPLLPPQTAATLGKTVVVAPHPDDESLGCGGLLALLAQAGADPQIVIVTDGSRSHPHSLSHPPERLAQVREQETLAALAALGCAPASAHFLRHPDCGLPTPPAFDSGAAELHEILVALQPATLIAPWRRDPHGDHQASWHLLRAAATRLPAPPRWLEYPVWAWTRPASEVAPHSDEASAWRLDISPVLDRKIEAIAQHRSQAGALIRDDPGGFVLAPEMLAHFHRSWELYLEPADG